MSEIKKRYTKRRDCSQAYEGRTKAKWDSRPLSVQLREERENFGFAPKSERTEELEGADLVVKPRKFKNTVRPVPLTIGSRKAGR